MHAATEAQRLLDAHVIVLLSGRSCHRAAVSLRQAQIHSATSHCACAQSSIEALTTREAALRYIARLRCSKGSMLSKLRPFQTLLLEVRQERGVAEREQATFLDLLAPRKMLDEERAHLS